jgi:hypothetical protein
MKKGLNNLTASAEKNIKAWSKRENSRLKSS